MLQKKTNLYRSNLTHQKLLTNQPLTTTYSRSPNHTPLFSISCHRSPLLHRIIFESGHKFSHAQSKPIPLTPPIYIYRFDIYRDSYPRLCVALRNKHRQKLIMRPWSIIIRPLSSAASSPHITVHNPDNKIPIVPVSSSCKSISANRESFDPDTRLRQPSLLLCFRMVRSGTTILLLFSLFLYFLLFFYFFLFFLFEHAYVEMLEGEKIGEGEKRIGTGGKWRRQESRSTSQPSLSHERLVLRIGGATLLLIPSRRSNRMNGNYLGEIVRSTRF